jgi:hypothetical protein
VFSVFSLVQKGAWQLTALALFMLSILIIGCSGEENPVADATIQKADWQIEISNDMPTATFEDGSTVKGWESYQKEVSQHTNADDFDGLSLVVTELPEETAGNSTADIKFSLWGYFIRFSAESNYLGGCIRRRAPHLGIMVSHQGVQQPIVNIHFIVWSENGKPCVGIYNSGSWMYFCQRMCGPSYSDIRNSIAGALMAAGIGYVVAELLASVITPVAVLIAL